MPSIDIRPNDPPVAQEFRACMSEAAAAAGVSNVYALLDGGRIPKLWAVLRELGNVEYLSLFREAPDESLVHVAPYLVRLDPAGDLPVYLTFQDQALDATMLVCTNAKMSDLHTHFRRFLLMKDSTGREVYFRFYDPRVFVPFVESSTPEEKAVFFGPVRSFSIFDPAKTAEEKRLRFKAFARTGALPTGIRLPDAKNKFTLRKEHEAELTRDLLARYKQQLFAYLRERHAVRLAGKPDEILDVLYQRATKEAAAVGLESGRDVTRMCELLLLGITNEQKAKINATEKPKRSEALGALRDELYTEQLNRMAAHG